MKASQLPRTAVALYRTFGPRYGGLRATYELRKRFDLYKEKPGLKATGTGPPLAFLRGAEGTLESVDLEKAIERAERVKSGSYHAFSGEWRHLPHEANEWSTNSLTGKAHGTAQTPWWEIATLSSSGDIKDVWEPGRFGWVFDLIRGFRLTGEPTYQEFFTDMLAAWAQANPPFRGPHWVCGQETSIRAVALLFAEANFPAIRDADRETLQNILLWSGERVADAIGYGVSQRNNHGISEATGLVLLGTRFADQIPDARGWRTKGARLLRRLVADQFAADGWYIQHSFNYMRLALHQLVLAELALRSQGESLGSGVHDRLRMAARLLGDVMVAENGLVPNYGQNDGANVLPISLAEYRDFRPVLSLACAVFGEPFPAEAAIDEESLAWLGLDPPARRSPAVNGVIMGESGWAVGRSDRFQFFLRAGSYRTRPGQFDPLQIELWMDGRPVILDPGTYKYTGSLKGSLASFEAHNGPRVDGYIAAIPGPRFLAIKWPVSRILQTGYDGHKVTVTAEIPAVVTRVVELSPEGVDVMDTPVQADAAMRVDWLIHPDADASVSFEGCQHQIRPPSEDGTDGRFAPTYGQLAPAIHIECYLESGAGSAISRFRPRRNGEAA